VALRRDPYRPVNGPAIGDLMNLFKFRHGDRDDRDDRDDE